MIITLVAAVAFACGSIMVWVLVERRRNEGKQLWEEYEAKRQEVNAKSKGLSEGLASLRKAQDEFNSKAVSYSELQAENRAIKRDLLNIDTTVRKLELDRRGQAKSQAELDARSKALAERYLAEVEQWISKSLTANNYVACRQRLAKAIEWCEGIGFVVPMDRKDALFANLKADYEMEVRAAMQREEQARIKAQIREEQLREREIQRELQNLEREREAIKAALDRALADAREEHSEEVERLRQRLAEAEERGQRALSQAQLTKAGHIYVISNIGSFGDSVFKIGMTRRLEPMDRIKELGDASVPFAFDVHMMISCEDAPRLEYALHKEFHRHRINKVNLRKEYFRVEIGRIREFVERHHGEVQYQVDAEALEFRQSLTMSEEDEEVIEEAFERARADTGAGLEDE